MEKAIKFRISLLQNQLNKARVEKERASNDFVKGLFSGEIIQTELAIEMFKELLTVHEHLENHKKEETT